MELLVRNFLAGKMAVNNNINEEVKIK